MPLDLSRGNLGRGSSPEKSFDGWRTPKPLFRAAQSHFGVICVVDSASSDTNHLCDVYLTEKQDTLSLPDQQLRQIILEAAYTKLGNSWYNGEAHAASAAVWSNPPYTDEQNCLDAWIGVAEVQYRLTKIPWIFCVPGSKSDQGWWHHYISHDPHHTAYVHRRVNFLNEDGTPGTQNNHPTVILAVGKTPLQLPNSDSSIRQVWK
jgi:hypothetical protein